MIDADAGWMPLYLSTVAGMSTALGAGVVFLHPKTYDEGSKYPRRNVSPGTMCFSLALAGSVMVTVSVISIGPECLSDPSGEGRWMSPWSWPFAYRATSFGLGWTLYVLLSKCAFPEPEEIIEASLMADGGAAATFPENAKGSPKKNAGGGISSSDGAGSGRDVEIGGASPSSTPPSQCSERVTTVPSTETSRGRPSPVQSRRTRRADSSLSAASEAKSESGAAHSAPLLDQEDNKKEKAPSLTSGATSSVLASMQSFSSFASGDDLGTRDQRRAWRVSMLLFVSLLCHNFPEGLGELGVKCQAPFNVR